MRWLVTGATGQVGIEVMAVLAGRAPDDDVIAAGHRDVDITDRDAVTALVTDARPDVVVNCAAYTDVDAAETDEAAATLVNAVGPGNLAAAASAAGARLLHLSTDYVFDGTADRPIPEDAPVAPRSAYGRSKAAGERRVLETPGDMHVVRTAWVYGATGRNFVKTIAALASTRDRLQVVDDQHGAPTWAAELARGLVLLGERPAGSVNPGVWHLTGAGSTTWCGFARAVVTLLGHDPAVVEPVPTTAFPRPAPRPAYAVLDMTRWRRSGLPMPPPWEVSLAAALPGVVAAG